MDSSREALLELQRLPENSACFDCGTPYPQWADIYYGVFLCFKCALYHRSLGPRISRILSLVADTWSKDDIHSLKTGGNAKAFEYLNAKEGNNVEGAYIYRQILSAKCRGEHFTAPSEHFLSLVSGPESILSPGSFSLTKGKGFKLNLEEQSDISPHKTTKISEIKNLFTGSDSQNRENLDPLSFIQRRFSSIGSRLLFSGNEGTPPTTLPPKNARIISPETPLETTASAKKDTDFISGLTSGVSLLKSSVFGAGQKGFQLASALVYSSGKSPFIVNPETDMALSKPMEESGVHVSDNSIKTESEENSTVGEDNDFKGDDSSWGADWGYFKTEIDHQPPVVSDSSLKSLNGARIRTELNLQRSSYTVNAPHDEAQTNPVIESRYINSIFGPERDESNEGWFDEDAQISTKSIRDKHPTDNITSNNSEGVVSTHTRSSSEYKNINNLENPPPLHRDIELARFDNQDSPIELNCCDNPVLDSPVAEKHLEKPIPISTVHQELKSSVDSEYTSSASHLPVSDSTSGDKDAEPSLSPQNLNSTTFPSRHMDALIDDGKTSDDLKISSKIPLDLKSTGDTYVDLAPSKTGILGLETSDLELPNSTISEEPSLDWEGPNNTSLQCPAPKDFTSNNIKHSPGFLVDETLDSATPISASADLKTPKNIFSDSAIFRHAPKVTPSHYEETVTCTQDPDRIVLHPTIPQKNKPDNNLYTSNIDQTAEPSLTASITRETPELQTIEQIPAHDNSAKLESPKRKPTSSRNKLSVSTTDVPSPSSGLKNIATSVPSESEQGNIFGDKINEEDSQKEDKSLELLSEGWGDIW